ncbi:MAG: exodeoxyribonuclease VII large subunit [Desulfobacterales bacterium]|jgi:exodeoxyribonuclease VII large subunit
MLHDDDKQLTDPFETIEEFEQVRKIYTVSELNAVIKSLLEQRFPFVWVVGEISNFRIPLSGHFYFTLKDESSQLNAVMFRGQHRQLKFEPEDGMRVTGMGRLSVYEPRGSYQIILEYLEPSGVGGLQIAYEKLKARLAEEGLFDQQYKKSLPFLPCKMALITSPSGAVVHDMLNIIDRRFPNMQIEIIPVKVQGTGAEDEIIEALAMLNDRNGVDVAILARGGGSLEDLQAFNSEPVARAIFASKIPIISAIGHETDYTIADFVADLRAPTPSAAAELAVPVKSELLQQVNDISADLKYRIQHAVDRLRQTLVDTSNRLIDPRRQIQDRRMRLDDFTSRISRRILILLNRKKEQLSWRSDRLFSNRFIPRVHNFNKVIEQYEYNLLKTYNIIKNFKSAQLRELTARLETLNPIAILERGYSITRTIPDLKVVFDPKSVSINQNLQVLVAKGTLTCRVKDKSGNGPKNIRTITKTA